MKIILLFLITPVLLDLLFGDPPNVPHPIIYIGKVISKYEQLIRKSKLNLKLGGFLLLFMSVVTVTIVISMVVFLIGLVSPILSVLMCIYLLYTSLASKCLDTEARKVHDSLLVDCLVESRVKLSYLVGRDTTSLSSEQVTKGAIETVAENTIDGVLAPLIFMSVGIYFGYPVQFAFFYKTINTLDSMVGYQNEKYKDLGFASAKLDDIVNFIPARIGSVCMLLGGLFLKMNFKNGVKILIRDRRNHKSPNCAYPESAVAGLLNISLGGTHTYFGEEVYKPTIGDDDRKVKPLDIVETINIMYMSEMILIVLIIMTYFIVKV